MSAARPLVRRAIVEHRAIVIPLAIVLLANALVYAVVVSPLDRRVNTVTERTRAAEAELAAARALHAQAAGTLTGTSRAAEELERFYADVLPAGPPDARRLAHPRLEQVARQASVRSLGTTNERERDPDRTLTRLRIETTIVGSYQGVRRFIHQLEQASEFMVIDQVALAEDATEDGLLTLDMELSTYYRETTP
jgi:Tfp pilus assembly protein PilO